MAKKKNHPKKFIKKMKKLLEERRASIRKNVSQIEEDALGSSKESSGDLSSIPVHSADLGTDSFERDQNIDEIQREQKQLDLIQKALDKINDEEDADYGRCEECEELVSKERLKAIPYTPYCIDCATEAEKNQR